MSHRKRRQGVLNGAKLSRWLVDLWEEPETGYQ